MVRAEQHVQRVELLAVADRDGDFDVDGAVDVSNWPPDAAGESSADLSRCENLVGESDTRNGLLDSGDEKNGFRTRTDGLTSVEGHP